MHNKFLKSQSSIHENQAEYSVLRKLSTSNKEKRLLIEFHNIKSIKEYFTDVHEAINNNYIASELSLISVNSEGEISIKKLDVDVTQLQKFDYINISCSLSNEHDSYILLISDDAEILYSSGNIDAYYESRFIGMKEIEIIERAKVSITELGHTFDCYKLNRKRDQCPFIKDNKIYNNIKERHFRNSLYKHLRLYVKGYVEFEKATNIHNDEESVDISIRDYFSQMHVIIEVKFFIGKDFFLIPDNDKYSFVRFRDGYEQLAKYCEHMINNNKKMHGAYLYMFYAHNATDEDIKKQSENYYKECENLKYLKQYYSDTILDRIL